MNSIWAVARNTIKQAVRVKIAVVFIILLVVLLPFMGVSMTGDGTIKGRIQTFVSYGLSLTSLLLCLFTIVISIYTLSHDIKYRQMYTVLTKPIQRFQLVIGKLLGVVILDVILLVLFAVVIYAIAVSTPVFLKADQEQLARLGNEFFTARVSLTPDEADVTHKAIEAYQKLEEAGTLPEKMSYEDIIDELAYQKRLEKRAAVPGQELIWQFENVKPFDPNETLFIKFKYNVSVNPLDLQVVGKWIIGDDRQLEYGQVLETPIYTFDQKNLVRTFHEIAVPADAVADDGYLAVGFYNSPVNKTVVIFPFDNGLQVLYRAGSFTPNFIRAIGLIMFRLIFLACLGMFTATFLSFPVAILFCLMVFLTGTISQFCLESFDYLSLDISNIYRYTLRPLVQLLPQFDKFNPVQFLVPAQLLSWLLLAKVFLIMVCLKAMLLLLGALFIFSRKEIAKVTI
jgi:hypothetical protein